MKQYDRLFERVAHVTGWKLDFMEVDNDGLKAEATFSIPAHDFDLYVEWRAPNSVKIGYFNSDSDDLPGKMEWVTPRLVEALTFVGFQVEV